MSASLYISRKNYSLRGGMGSAGRGIRQRAVPTLTVTEYSGLGSLWQKSRGRCGGFAYRCLRPRTRPIVVETRSYLIQYCIVSTPRSGCDAAAHQLSGLLPKAARSLQNGVQKSIVLLSTLENDPIENSGRGGPDRGRAAPPLTRNEYSKPGRLKNGVRKQTWFLLAEISN